MKDLLTLTKIKNGDVKAFEQVFRLYYMPLCMFAASITGRMDIAEEIVQELFYVFWKERERLQLFHTIKSYLYGAVRNQSLQYWEHQDVRNRYRDAILSHPDKDDTPDDPQEQIEYKELEADFLKFATEKGMVGIKGHRSVGGFRASCYNAMPKESVQALIDCMQEFEKLH